MTDESMIDKFAESGGAMVPLIGPFTGLIAGEISKALRMRIARNASVAIAAAEAIARMSRDELGRAIADNPELVPLYVRILYAAGMNGSEKVLVAMGIFLGKAINDVKKGNTEFGDEAELVLKSLDNLSTIDFKILEILVSMHLLDSEGTPRTHLLPAEIAEATKLESEMAGYRLLALASSGLVSMTSLIGGMGYGITDMGRAVLAAIAELPKT
jgi:hypothetical protein